jgi:hypothetical protein
VADLFLQENTTERVKLFTLFSGEEDELLARYSHVLVNFNLCKTKTILTEQNFPSAKFREKLF